jgi:hypothetical protein
MTLLNIRMAFAIRALRTAAAELAIAGEMLLTESHYTEDNVESSHQEAWADLLSDGAVTVKGMADALKGAKHRFTAEK